jgi:uncharacterized coiled-coil protein SlyX
MEGEMIQVEGLNKQFDDINLKLADLKQQLDTVDKQLDDMKTGVLAQSRMNLEGLSAAVADTNYKLDGLDKNVVNRLSELLLELQKQTLYQNKQFQTEQSAVIDKLSRSVKRGHTFLWLILILNIFGLGILTFLVLYVLEIIPFSF